MASSWPPHNATISSTAPLRRPANSNRIRSSLAPKMTGRTPKMTIPGAIIVIRVRNDASSRQASIPSPARIASVKVWRTKAGRGYASRILPGKMNESRLQAFDHPSRTRKQEQGAIDQERKGEGGAGGGSAVRRTSALARWLQIPTGDSPSLSGKVGRRYLPISLVGVASRKPVAISASPGIPPRRSSGADRRDGEAGMRGSPPPEPQEERARP